MATKRILFYATKQDLIEIINMVEKDTKIKYFKAGLLNVEEVREYQSLMEDEGIGVVDRDSSNSCSSYLILGISTKVNVREVPQLKGGVKYAIDQKINETSVIFRPCGVLKTAKAIIQGELSTIHSNRMSMDIFNNIVRKVKSRFTNIKGCFLGKEALSLFEEGWRLTQNIKSPKEYDLLSV